VLIRSALVAASLLGVTALPLGASTIQSRHSALIDSPGAILRMVQYDGSCRRWRRDCSTRWGWNTTRYFRCMERRGC
jgi:hypothetical protein